MFAGPLKIRGTFEIYIGPLEALQGSPQAKDPKRKFPIETFKADGFNRKFPSENPSESSSRPAQASSERSRKNAGDGSSSKASKRQEFQSIFSKQTISLNSSSQAKHPKRKSQLAGASRPSVSERKIPKDNVLRLKFPS